MHRRLFKPTIGIFDRRFNRRQLIWQLFTDFVSQHDQFSSQNITQYTLTVSIGRRQQLEDSPQTATDSSQTARRQFASQTAHKLSADNLQTARRQFTDNPQTPPDSPQTVRRQLTDSSQTVRQSPTANSSQTVPFLADSPQTQAYRRQLADSSVARRQLTDSSQTPRGSSQTACRQPTDSSETARRQPADSSQTVYRHLETVRRQLADSKIINAYIVYAL